MARNIKVGPWTFAAICLASAVVFFASAIITLHLDWRAALLGSLATGVASTVRYRSQP